MNNFNIAISNIVITQQIFVAGRSLNPKTFVRNFNKTLGQKTFEAIKTMSEPRPMGYRWLALIPSIAGAPHCGDVTICNFFALSVLICPRSVGWMGRNTDRVFNAVNTGRKLQTDTWRKRVCVAVTWKRRTLPNFVIHTNTNKLSRDRSITSIFCVLIGRGFRSRN